MNNILIALGLGIAAGIIDVIPMIISKQEKSACASAFMHWLVLGLIIPFINWGMAPWLSGIMIALLCAIPVMIMVFPNDRKALIPMTISSIVLGAAIGDLGSRLIG